MSVITIIICLLILSLFSFISIITFIKNLCLIRALYLISFGLMSGIIALVIYLLHTV